VTSYTATAAADNGILMVVDIQDRLLSAMPEVDKITIVKSVKTLLQSADLLSVPVIVTEQYPKGLGATNSTITEHLPSNTSVIEKTKFSASQVEKVGQLLQKSGRQQIYLAGMESHICITQTAIDLLSRGYQVFVLEDAICSRNSLNHQNAVSRLRQAGVIITNVESLVFEWLKDAQHPHFRTISKWIV